MNNTTIYDFVTTSDAVTFLAESDKVACIVGALVSTAGFVTRYDNGKKVDYAGVSVPFNQDAVSDIESLIGSSIDDFVDANKEAIIESLNSFSYGSVRNRLQYNAAIEAITDPAKLEEFKVKHEDFNRTSMNQIVKRAWYMGKAIAKKEASHA